MSIGTYSWETKLLEQAYKAFREPVTSEAVKVNKQTLDEAYLHCRDLTKFHSRTFYMASGLLPKDKRRAARALYAFCRISDDLVDRSEGDLQESLDSWKKRALSNNTSPDDPVALAWADTRLRYHIPLGYAEQLIHGVARDITPNHYATFDELAEYSYGVASTVGLMVMHIIGFSGPEAIPYAIKLGVSLQLTNILRDIGEDWQDGRLYLPQDELTKFGLSKSDIAAGINDVRWRSFMDFQIERNRRLYEESLPGIALLDPDGRFAIAAAAELYRAILDDIEAHDYDVFRRRAYVSKQDKLKHLPGIWWRSKTLAGYQ